MIENFCEFFKRIENDPSAIVSGLTIGDVIYAKQHLRSCEQCRDICERVVEEDRKRHEDDSDNGNIIHMPTGLN